MWTSEQRGKKPVGEPTAEMGTVTLGGDPAGVNLGGERRWLPVFAPGGYRWRPTVGDKVLVLKTGSQGENPCILGLEQDLGELGPGEVRLQGMDSALQLSKGQVELTGQVRINGQTLEELITRIVLEIVG